MEQQTDSKLGKGDFPGSPEVKNLPCNAKDASWIPGQGTKIPHVRGQLNWHAATKEVCVQQQRPSTTEQKREKKGSGPTYTHG